MVKKNPFATELRLTKSRIMDTSKRVNENYRKNRYNLTDEKRVKAKLKKVRALISEIDFM